MKPNRGLLLVWAVALLLRLIPVLLIAPISLGLDDPNVRLGRRLEDIFQYDDLAQNILAGNGYVWYGGIPTAFRPPLYPVFLAIVYFFFGPNILPARLVQAILGSLLPIPVYFLAGRIFKNERVSKISAWLVALYPIFWLYPLALATENLYVPLLTVLVISILWAEESQLLGQFLVCGVSLGLAALTRSVVSGFVPLLLFWIWRYTAGGLGERLKRIALVTVAFLALTIPWSLRNTLLFGEPIFIESSLGFDLYMGYHPQSQGTMNTAVALEILEETRAVERMSFQVEKDIHDLGIEQTLEFIGRDPGRVLYLVVSKVSHLFRFDTRGAMYFYSNNYLGSLPIWVLLLVAALLILPTAFVLIMAAAGVVLAGWGPKTGLINLLLLYYTGIHALILAEPRFLLPLIPFLAIYAAKGLVSFPEVFADRRRAILAASLWLLLFLNWGYEFWVEAEKWQVILSPGGHLAGFSY